MRILHTSDWQLNQNFMGKSRVEEHEAFLSWLLEIIENIQITLLLVSGDIFNTETSPNHVFELYYNFLKYLSIIKTLKTTIITADNHDSVSILKVPKQLLEVLNVHVITSRETLSHKEKLANNGIKAFYETSYQKALTLIYDVSIYYIGASLKDLGKKWFAFSKIDMDSFNVLCRLANEKF